MKCGHSTSRYHRAAMSHYFSRPRGSAPPDAPPDAPPVFFSAAPVVLRTVSPAPLVAPFAVLPTSVVNQSLSEDSIAATGWQKNSLLVASPTPEVAVPSVSEAPFPTPLTVLPTVSVTPPTVLPTVSVTPPRVEPTPLVMPSHIVRSVRVMRWLTWKLCSQS